MKVFKETIDESARRISEQTLIFCLFFTFVGILMVVTQHFYMSGEYWGTYLVEKGPIVVIGVGISLTVWSLLTLWICYFRRVRRVLPHISGRINWFFLLVGICLGVAGLPHLVYMPRVYRMISLVGLIVLFIYAHFFHRGVKSALGQGLK